MLEKQDRRQIFNNKETKHKQKKETTQNTAKQNCAGLVASYDNRPGNELGLFYSAIEPIRGSKKGGWWKC